MIKKRLVTSALPYVNNEPHLGNLVQVLSADCYARYCRCAGYETLYICGADEYGTASEILAMKKGVEPQKLCDHYFELHKEIYQWFCVDFDHFGRTSQPEHTKIVQGIFKTIDQAGYIIERESNQLFCGTCQRFLADRFVTGTCPRCGALDTRGDQCEQCSEPFDALELKDPSCSLCASVPSSKKTKHLYLDLPNLANQLSDWMKKSHAKSFWSVNALTVTESWIKRGLEQRCITRDLKWGVPVPKEGFEGKVFYVWFDALLGYISMTEKRTEKWKLWWKTPQNVDLVQFIGKDNIPFHTIIFPACLISTGEEWVLPYCISSSEYLTYEGSKFSKSRGIGVFGGDCRNIDIDVDMWRFYLFLNRPEKHDSQFMWKEFQERVNRDLIGNLGNFIHRVLTFCHKFHDGKVASLSMDNYADFRIQVSDLRKKILNALEAVQIRNALQYLLQLGDLGNKTFQLAEPWRLVRTNLKESDQLIGHLLYVVHDIGQLIWPFLPSTAEKIVRFFGKEISWDLLGTWDHLAELQLVEPITLFKRIEDITIQNLQAQFSKNKSENQNNHATQTENKKLEFTDVLDVRVALIKDVLLHPDAEKLYILKLSLGDKERQIVSSIVPYYRENELRGKSILIVYNLKRIKIRGVSSQGMLLAVGDGSRDECEVFFVNHAHGVRVLPEGQKDCQAQSIVTYAEFEQYPMETKDGYLVYQGKKLLMGNDNVPVMATRYKNSFVH